MKRRVVVAAAALIALGTPAVEADAASRSSNASCVATITSFEASQLEPGAVGNEVSGFATSEPGLGSWLVSGLAGEHRGTIEECLAAEGA